MLPIGWFTTYHPLPEPETSNIVIIYYLPPFYKNLQTSIVILATFRNVWSSPFEEVFQISLSTIFWQMFRDDMPLKFNVESHYFQVRIILCRKGCPFWVMFHVSCSSPWERSFIVKSFCLFWLILLGPPATGRSLAMPWQKMGPPLPRRRSWGGPGVVSRCIWVFPKIMVPPKHPKMIILVGKPMVVGYHHFRKPPKRYLETSETWRLWKSFFPRMSFEDGFYDFEGFRFLLKMGIWLVTS